MPVADSKAMISRVAARRPSSIIDKTSTLFLKSRPGTMITFAGGMPNGKFFPFIDATFQLNDGSEVFIDEDEMAAALQYGSSDGYPPLVEFLVDFQKRVHGGANSFISNNADWSVLPVPGAMDGISKAFEMFLDEGDTYLLEYPVFPGAFNALRPFNARAIGVEGDGDGLIPEVIRGKIEEARKKGWPLPKFLYTCPTASNPTGTTTTPERRRQIYKLAQEFGFYIIEDDPYYFIRFDNDTPLESYLSIDTEGRVLRVDSFSKVLSAGMRLGFVTGPLPLLRHVKLQLQYSQLHPSGLAQVVVNNLLRQWGVDRYLEHCREVAEFYQSQMEKMVSAAEKHLQGLVEFHRPTGGMFLWMKILGVVDAKELIMTRAAAKKVLFLPGFNFNPDFVAAEQMPEAAANLQYVRASFSRATDDEFDDGFRRLRDAIDEELVKEDD